VRRCVYVGRPSKWGNPFAMVSESCRDAVCDRYDRYLATRLINGAITEQDFREFDGKNLLCWCAPKRCHGDTILRLYRMAHPERLEWAHEILGVHG
jgi:uncharacterized secreted protein with C-terminal beta-propeller domain